MAFEHVNYKLKFFVKNYYHLDAPVPNLIGFNHLFRTVSKLLRTLVLNLYVS